jgi:hypothetical protein
MTLQFLKSIIHCVKRLPLAPSYSRVQGLDFEKLQTFEVKIEAGDQGSPPQINQARTTAESDGLGTNQRPRVATNQSHGLATNQSHGLATNQSHGLATNLSIELATNQRIMDW